MFRWLILILVLSVPSLTAAQECLDYSDEVTTSATDGLGAADTFAWSGSHLFGLDWDGEGYILKVGTVDDDGAVTLLDQLALPEESFDMGPNAILTRGRDVVLRSAGSIHCFRLGSDDRIVSRGVVGGLSGSNRTVTLDHDRLGCHRAISYHESRFEIVDFETFELLASFPLPNDVQRASLIDGRLYFGLSDYGEPLTFVVWDLSDPDHPAELGSNEIYNFNEDGWSGDAVVLGIAPLQERIAVLVQGFGYNFSWRVWGDHYEWILIRNGEDGIPIPDHRINVGGCAAQDCGGMMIPIPYLVGDGILAAVRNQHMGIYDVSDPSFPVFMTSLAGVNRATMPQGGLFLTDDAEPDLLKIWNVPTDAYDPIATSLALPTEMPAVRRILTAGDTVAVALGGDSNDPVAQVHLYVDRPEGLELLAVAGEPRSVGMNAGLALAAGRVAVSWTDGLRVHSAVDGALLGSWPGEGAHAIALDQGHLYAFRSNGDLEIYALAEPGAAPVATASLPATRQALLYGDHLYAAGGRLVVLDVSVPAQPVLLGETGYGPDIMHMVRKGDRLCMARSTGYQVWSLEDPELPRLLSSGDDIAAEQVAVYGDHLLVSAGDRVTIYDAANPVQLRRIGSIPMTTTVRLGSGSYGPLVGWPGILARLSPPCGASVPVELREEIPDNAVGLALAPPHPNPFNPSTELTYRLTVPGPVELTIHDPAGRRVRTLVTGARPVGTHTSTWDGRDQSGRPLPAGVYLARLRVEDRSETRKLVLLK